MKQNAIKFITNILSIFYLYGCASQAVPTGGKKDIEPPNIEASIPKDKSTNFPGKQIEIVFNELVSIENIKQELLITPRPEGNYEYELKKNRLSLTFEKPFQKNTTYTFNFRKSIKDVTEKNIAENAKIVFSTGDIIDSLYIAGKMTDLLTNKPVEEGLILLYKADDTLKITKHAPYYLTKTDKSGNYLLENLKEDTYLIYALSEKNNNQKYDQEKEKIGFLNTPINLTDNIDTLNFTLSIIDTLPPKLLKPRPDAEYYQLEFNEGLSKISIKHASNNNQLYYQIQDPNKVRVYNTINSNDSIPIIVTALDSIGNKLEKEVNIKFNSTANTSGNNNTKEKRKEKLNISIKPSDGEKVEKNFIYNIGFSKPIQKYSLDSVSLLADTLTPIKLNLREDFKWNEYYTELSINKKIVIQKNIRVIIPEGTFYSVEGDTSAKFVTTHDLKDIADYGSISGNVNTTEKKFIVQLIDAESKVMDEQKNIQKYRFDYLAAGKYRIRVIIDSNGNGKWDQGNFNEKRQPESIVFSQEEINLKENWEMVFNEINI
ncbi:Ig-like domain-containing protein [Rhodocytophaga rosea]|uniref:Ig-like domain-containing protein n=1 Tax=Rhodocytophaga rosea TaxID=2704465 RepID=A0A6C0GIN5_9BACT|nr:Ig-like domain-containing protein [Rhodocytophaga rosea]QHT67906.1 Ig-like domain-containing protein [Rhodocytophaga rosea]